MDPNLRSLTKAFRTTPTDNLTVCAYLQARIRSGLPIEISEIEIATPEIQAVLDSAPVELLLVYGYSVDLLRDCVWQPLVEVSHSPNTVTEIVDIRWLPRDKWVAVSCQDIYTPEAEYRVRIQLHPGNAIDNILVSGAYYWHDQPLEQYLTETIIDEQGYQGDEFRILDYELLAPGEPRKWTSHWARLYHLDADWIGPSRWFAPAHRLTNEELDHHGPQLQLKASNYHKEPCQAVREATEKYRARADSSDLETPLFSLPRIAPKKVINFPQIKSTKTFRQQVKMCLKELQEISLQEFMHRHHLGENGRLLVDMEFFDIYFPVTTSTQAALTAIEKTQEITHLPVLLLEKYPTIALPT